MELRELVLLDNEFFSLLDFGERIAVEDTIKDIDLSEFGEKLLNKAQKKWIKTFFKEESIYKELDPIAIGIVLKKIREVKGYSKTKMAQDIRFHRTYIARVEKGEMLPSLEFVYRFCKICEISIDRILNLIE